MSVKAVPPANEDNMVVQNEDQPPERDTAVQKFDKNNAVAISDKKELPKIECEMIPEELLFALTTSDVGPNKLGPVKNLKTPERLRVAMKKGPPSNVWHHKSRRAQFQHLTDNPRSLGKGAGTRDISFLYDVATKQSPAPTHSSKQDQSAVRLEAQAGDLPKVSSLRVPDTVIPEEYHLVKTKAVLGLEFIDEKLTTLITDKEKTLRLFPSLQPTKRYEVIQLLKTLETMMEQSGVNDVKPEVKGPTQLHNLLELVKKEQNIYDLVFSEVIRQVSVECIERGQLLSKLRGRYADLLNRIPRQVQSLHAEVMAQRSLDRRLTEELFRFKASISYLTTELQAVREHDHRVTCDAELAGAELAKALQESQVNANLVDEYHDLYELQRRRLEGTVTSLSIERELWSNAAYDLALKITSINSLNTAKRLHVSEKAWSKLSNHFVVMLSDCDSERLVNMQKHVEKWRETMFHFNQNLEAADKRTINLLRSLKEELESWITKFDETLVTTASDVRAMKPPSMDFVRALCDFFLKFEEKLGEDSERFGGGQLLANEEKLGLMKEEVDAWTEIAWEVYRRHKSETGEDFPLSSTLKELNNDLHDLTKQLQIRITGENGVAKGVMNIQSTFDSWVNKLTLLLHSGDTMTENEWWLAYDRLGEYIVTINEIFACIGTHQRDEDRMNKLPHQHISIEEVMKKVRDWMKQTMNEVEAEDGKLMAQITSVHEDLVLWMVQMLLHLVPNFELDHTASSESSMGASCSQEQLVSKARTIGEHISRLTEYFWQCCSDLVQTAMQERKDRGDDDPDHEYRDFLRVKYEAKEWIRTCEFLLNSILLDKVGIFNKDIMERLQLPDEKGGSSLNIEVLSRPSTQELESKQRINALAATKPKTQSTADVQEETVAADVTQPLQQKETAVLKVKEESASTDAELQVEQEAANEEAQKLAAASKAAEEEVSLKAKMNIQVLGDDENIQQARLEQTEARAKRDDLPTPTTSLLQSAYDAIASMEQVQKQLLDTEVRAQLAEQRIIELEQELYSSHEKERALEKTVSKLEHSVHENDESVAYDRSEAFLQESTASIAEVKHDRTSTTDSLKRSSVSRSSIKQKKHSVNKKK